MTNLPNCSSRRIGTGKCMHPEQPSGAVLCRTALNPDHKNMRYYCPKEKKWSDIKPKKDYQKNWETLKAFVKKEQNWWRKNKSERELAIEFVLDKMNQIEKED